MLQFVLVVIARFCSYHNNSAKEIKVSKANLKKFYGRKLAEHHHHQKFQQLGKVNLDFLEKGVYILKYFVEGANYYKRIIKN